MTLQMAQIATHVTNGHLIVGGKKKEGTKQTKENHGHYKDLDFANDHHENKVSYVDGAIVCSIRASW